MQITISFNFTKPSIITQKLCRTGNHAPHLLKDVARTGSFIDDDVLCPRVPSSLQWNVVNHKSWTRASQSRKRQFYCANRAAISRESNRLDQLPWDISKRERQAGDKLFCYARCHIEPLLITYLNELERRKNQPLKTRSVASRGSHTYVWSTPNIRKVFMTWSRAIVAGDQRFLVGGNYTAGFLWVRVCLATHCGMAATWGSKTSSRLLGDDHCPWSAAGSTREQTTGESVEVCAKMSIDRRKSWLIQGSDACFGRIREIVLDYFLQQWWSKLKNIDSVQSQLIGKHKLEESQNHLQFELGAVQVLIRSKKFYIFN